VNRGIRRSKTNHVRGADLYTPLYAHHAIVGTSLSQEYQCDIYKASTNEVYGLQVFPVTYFDRHRGANRDVDVHDVAAADKLFPSPTQESPPPVPPPPMVREHFPLWLCWMSVTTVIIGTVRVVS
jgi:hypothetical protein